jgi:trimeric autotransporter adhesin
VTIPNSIEGIESPFITINSGNVSVVSSDDCYNATFGNGGENNDGSLLTISGGYVVANTSGGDGLDSNGNMLINGGTVIVHGPQSAPEVGMDYNGTCNVNGGFLVISGTNSNMTQAPSSTSTQHSIKASSNQSLAASTLFHIQDASAVNILTFQPLRSYYSIVFSSSDLQSGASYSIYTGGTSTGTNTNGLYTGGTYSGGTFKKTFTINSMITNVTF